MKLRSLFCNSCGTEFKPKIREKKHKDGVEGLLTIQYFSCPKCKRNYVYSIQNKELQNMIKEKNHLYKSLQNVNNEEESEVIIKKHKALESKIKSKHDHLKFYFSKYV